ncbi:MAG: MFS transporter [Candidatus Hodarchaeota archaeon]
MSGNSDKFTEQPTNVMVSYGSGKFLAEFFAQAFGVIVFFYYEVVVDLDVGLAALGFILYSLWNALNDPLIGYLTEKHTTRFSSKFGRRFPWIFFGSILYVFSFLIIFFIPAEIQSNQFTLFLWLVISTCLFDTLYSLWDVNYQSIFPDKFRTETERNRTAGIATAIGVVGIAAGFILPTVFTDSGIPGSYITNAIIFIIIGIMFVVLLVGGGGVMESSDMIQRYLTDRSKKEGENFLNDFKNAFKERNFVAWIVLYFFYQSAVVTLTASVEYVGDFILPPEESNTLIFVGLLVGALIALPIWLRLFKRIKSNQRIMIITAVLMALFVLPMIFVSTLNEYTIFVFLFGLGFGGYWMIMTPALADVIDEIVIKTGKRNDGIFMGFRAFFGRLAFAVQALSFWMVHELTGFDGSVDDQIPSAIFGIHLHTGLFPAIFLIIGVLVFWKLNDLNPEKVERNKRYLAEKGL